MPILDTGIRAVANRMPKVISPETHAVLDYITAGGFLLGAALFWANHRRAAVASLACGLAELGTTMTTDFPGGVTPAMSFQTHGKIEGGLAATCGLLPMLMMFGDDPRAYFFRGMALNLTTVAALTDWDAPTGTRSERRRSRLDRRTA